MMHNFHRNVQAPGNFTGQMAITNSATHEFDVARFVLEREFSAVSVFQPKFSESGKAAAVFVVLETVDGPLGRSRSTTMPLMAMKCAVS